MELEQIRGALETVHSPAVASAQRQDAQALLEAVKARKDAALIGYTLQQPPSATTEWGPVRHFGLTLLAQAIATQFGTWDEPTRTGVRQWIVELALGLVPGDAHYVREKVAYLWVELAKRTWGIETRLDDGSGSSQPSDALGSAETPITDGWVDMDRQLLGLWIQGGIHREFVLSVLCNLFEDVYLVEDAVAARRAAALGSQTIEILANASDLDQVYSERAPQLRALRADQEGWLSRFVAAAAAADPPSVRVLETLRATLAWCPATALLSSHVLDVLVAATKTSDVQARVVAVDALHLLLCGRNWSPADAAQLFSGVFGSEGIAWLAEVYSKTSTDPMDDAEYVFTKKFIELVVGLGDHVHGALGGSSASAVSSAATERDPADYKAYFELLLRIVQHPSLVAAGLSLQLWCSVLRDETLLDTHPEVEALLPALLEVAAQRCIQHDLLPDDALPKQYMDVDFDQGSPDAQQFYGSFRHYMEDVVRLVVCRLPEPAVRWLHEQQVAFFGTAAGQEAVQVAHLDQHSPAYVYGASQLAVVQAAIRGVSRWQIWAPATERTPETEQQILGLMAVWSNELLTLPVSDPALRRDLVQCVVQFAPLLRANSPVLLRILEKVLEAATARPQSAERGSNSDSTGSVQTYPGTSGNSEPLSGSSDDEALRDLRTAAGTELNRLAYMVPEALAEIWDDLERVVGGLLEHVRPHEAVSFRSFLLVVSQRAPAMRPQAAAKFAQIVDPVLSSWTEPHTIQGLVDLEWFMERVGIVAIAEYFRARGITATTNLLETAMDDRGRALRTELKSKWERMFPIRPSRIFIQYSIERLDHSSAEYQHLLQMWKPRVQPILPHILKLVAQIMAYHDPANWGTLPPEVQTFVRTSCTERFWQVGISMQTRDEFEHQSQEASKTVRDFADSVGHIVRYTREYAFLTLGSISQLEETMFEVPDMGLRLFEALASTTRGVTAHCWRHMISLVVRNVVRNCPPDYVTGFLGQFLPPFLTTLESVLVNMWDKQGRQGFQMAEQEGAPAEEDLSEEMMEEHLLRQLTAIVDRLLIDLVGQASKQEALSDSQSAVRRLCRRTPEILGPILALCRDIMGFRDSRCCFNTCLVVRGLLTSTPAVPVDDPVVLQLFLTEMLPACLRILADPYFHESHSEAGTILTLVYLLGLRTDARPRDHISQLLPHVPSTALDVLDSTMSEQRPLRQHRGVLLEFLTEHRVLAVDEQARARNRKRELRLSLKKPQTQPDQHLDAATMISMFGE